MHGKNAQISPQKKPNVAPVSNPSKSCKHYQAPTAASVSAPHIKGVPARLRTRAGSSGTPYSIAAVENKKSTPPGVPATYTRPGKQTPHLSSSMKATISPSSLNPPTPMFPLRMA